VNLDYKLREELREELTSLFNDGDTTVVYATTEPQEALLLGGHTAVLDAGRLLQFGPTLQTWAAPNSVRVAAIFNDPPMNLLAAKVEGAEQVRLSDGTLLPLPGRTLPLPAGADCQIGVRCHHLRAAGVSAAGKSAVGESAGAVTLTCVLDLAELSGSETYLHLHHAGSTLVAQWPGVHNLALGSQLTLMLQAQEVFVFDAGGALISAPATGVVTGVLNTASALAAGSEHGTH
jgi:glycerol transport system ATP-binding protein